MAYLMRGICKRSVNLLPRRVYPICVRPSDDDNHTVVSSPNSVPTIRKNFFPHIGLGYGLSSVFLAKKEFGVSSVFLERDSFLRPRFGVSRPRYMSSKGTPPEFPDKVDSIDLVGTEDVLEVAIATADSPLKDVDLFNTLSAHFINDVHFVTGLNWSASIALTSLIISGLTFPMLLYVSKAVRKIDIMRPQLEQLRQEIRARVQVSDPEAMAKEVGKQVAILNKKYGVNVTAFLSLSVIQGCVLKSFSDAVNGMVKTVPSFKTGGMLWFIDLTTPDSMYILPLFSSLNFWILMQLFLPSYLKGLLNARYEGKILIAVLVPLSLFLPSAIFCYWLPSQLFYIVYGLAIRQPSMKKLLNFPELTVSPTLPSSKEKKNKN